MSPWNPGKLIDRISGFHSGTESRLNPSGATADFLPIKFEVRRNSSLSRSNIFQYLSRLSIWLGWRVLAELKPQSRTSDLLMMPWSVRRT